MFQPNTVVAVPQSREKVISMNLYNGWMVVVVMSGVMGQIPGKGDRRVRGRGGGDVKVAFVAMLAVVVEVVVVVEGLLLLVMVVMVVQVVVMVLVVGFPAALMFMFLQAH